VVSLKAFDVFKTVQNVRYPNELRSLSKPAPAFKRARAHSPPASQVELGQEFLRHDFPRNESFPLRES
jgi:hypothetical protein